MTRKSKGSAGADSALDRVFALLDEAINGMHDVVPATHDLAADLPPALMELYTHCDGARLYLDTLEIRGPKAVERDEDGRWVFAILDEETPITVDAKGRVWRPDATLDADICDGSSLERWLAGWVDATALLYDEDGEFADGVFDEEGELVPEITEQQLRAQLKRDPKAPGPRWRLAQAMLAQDAIEPARKQLEELVANEPAFAWGWLELAHISEHAGDLEIALDDARAAADAAKGHEQEGYFWAQVARLAVKQGDEKQRTQAAARVGGELKVAQLAGAKALLVEGDAEGARKLTEILLAVWPRDLEVLDLQKQLERLPVVN